MIKSQELKLFCDKFNLDFPDFDIVSTYNMETNTTLFACNIKWYNLEFSGPCHTNKNDSILSVIAELSEWLNCDENFISLMTMKSHSMPIN